MKKNFLILFIALSGCLLAQKHVFYLHGRIVEVQGANAVETANGFGAYLYNDIIDSLKAHGFVVHSELRPNNTEVIKYAQKLKNELLELINTGVKPGDITIIGASKGGEIAIQLCALMQNSELNFVFLAACYEPRTLALAGNVLSIYETSDQAGSCGFFLEAPSQKIQHYKEVSLSTGLRHGFIYKPLQAWLQPSICWARGQYDDCQQGSVH